MRLGSLSRLVSAEAAEAPEKEAEPGWMWDKGRRRQDHHVH